MKVPLRSLSLEAYRGIAGLVLDELAPVSLVIGANNAGKSSILEAAALVLRPQDHSQWVGAVRRRDMDMALVDGVWSMFPSAQTLRTDEDMVASSKILLSAKRDVEARVVEATALALQVPGLEETGGLAVDVWIKVDGGNAESLRFPTSEAVSKAPGTRVFTVTPASHYSSHTFVEQLSQVIDAGRKQLAIELLKIFDEHVKDLDVSASLGRKAVRVTHGSRGVVDLSSFGDGMRRAAALALALSRSARGVLLVDEIEAGIHHSVLRHVLGQLLQAAELAEVQLIATTHSLEAVDACIASVADRGAEATLAAFWVLRKDGRHEVRRYDHARLLQLREGGLDIR